MTAAATEREREITRQRDFSEGAPLLFHLPDSRFQAPDSKIKLPSEGLVDLYVPVRYYNLHSLR